MFNENAYGESNLVKYSKLAQLLAIITENTSDLLDELIEIENMFVCY